jgi:hypothetical protein
MRQSTIDRHEKKPLEVFDATNQEQVNAIIDLLNLNVTIEELNYSAEDKVKIKQHLTDEYGYEE